MLFNRSTILLFSSPQQAHFKVGCADASRRFPQLVQKTRPPIADIEIDLECLEEVVMDFDARRKD